MTYPLNKVIRPLNNWGLVPKFYSLYEVGHSHFTSGSVVVGPESVYFCAYFKQTKKLSLVASFLVFCRDVGVTCLAVHACNVPDLVTSRQSREGRQITFAFTVGSWFLVPLREF